jgi:hypoxanthine phosphoribosyltransferase
MQVVLSHPAAPVRGGGRPMISARRIAKRVRAMGQEISSVYADLDQPLVLIVILKGAAVFAADLLRSLSIPAELEFVRASSYGSGTSSSGKVKLAHLVEGPLTGRHLLLVEDIVDSGRTISVINEELLTHNPASLRLATLLDRPARREVPVDIHFTGFVIPDRFVIGYGLDYAGLYRELPGIYSLG